MSAEFDFSTMSDRVMPTKRMTDDAFATLARCLKIPEDVLRAEEAKVWAESLRRGIAPESHGVCVGSCPVCDSSSARPRR